MQVFIRWLIRRDMSEVLAIEQLCFEFPWTEEDFWGCLRQRNCIGMVAEDEAQNVVAYVVYELHKHRLAILNLCVGNPWQRRGVGTQIIARMIDKLHQQRRTEIIVETRERNLDAQLFFKAMGFRATDVIRDHYEDTDEDCYVFQYRLPRERKRRGDDAVEVGGEG